MNPDIDKIAPSTRSAINIDNGETSADLGLGGFIIKELYADFMLVEFIDATGGLTVDEKTGLAKVDEIGQKTWRKAIVRVVGHLVKATKVGDIVTFPDDKGLKTSTIKYKTAEGEVHDAVQAAFVNEWRVFAKLEKAS